MTHVCVVVPSPVLQEGLRMVFDREMDLRLVAAVSSENDAIKVLETERVDVILINLNLPGTCGLSVLQTIRKRFPATASVILRQSSTEVSAVRAMKMGAHGTVSVDGPIEEILTAIRTVAKGHHYVSNPQRENLLNDLLEGTERPPHERLSNREFEILCLFGDGRTTGQIAQSLNISTATVSTHRKHILDKLGLESTGQLVRFALENHLSPDS